MPYIASAGEIKTKPTQHSVKELREIGIQPDVLLCRADRPLPEDERRKIALFTNVQSGSGDLGGGRRLASTRSRAMLHAQKLDDIVCRKLDLEHAAGRPRARGTSSSTRSSIREHEVDIALVGKYVDLTESYKSLSEALIHAGIHTGAKIKIHYIDSETIEKNGTGRPRDMDAILVPGGFGKRGVEGKIEGDPLRARERRAVSRHLPRHAARGDRVRAQRRRPRRRATAPSSTARRRIR